MSHLQAERLRILYRLRHLASPLWDFVQDQAAYQRWQLTHVHMASCAGMDSMVMSGVDDDGGDNGDDDGDNGKGDEDEKNMTVLMQTAQILHIHSMLPSDSSSCSSSSSPSVTPTSTIGRSHHHQHHRQISHNLEGIPVFVPAVQPSAHMVQKQNRQALSQSHQSNSLSSTPATSASHSVRSSFEHHHDPSSSSHHIPINSTSSLPSSEITTLTSSSFSTAAFVASSSAAASSSSIPFQPRSLHESAAISAIRSRHLEPNSHVYGLSSSSSYQHASRPLTQHQQQQYPQIASTSSSVLVNASALSSSSSSLLSSSSSMMTPAPLLGTGRAFVGFRTLEYVAFLTSD